MAKIPMAVLAGIMAIVAFKTFNWHSVQPAAVKAVPVAETAVMLVTVAATVFTGNLAIGVVGGIIVMAIIPARLKHKHRVKAGKSSPDQGK
jgi:SulP family sulfate permease